MSCLSLKTRAFAAMLTICLWWSARLVAGRTPHLDAMIYEQLVFPEVEVEVEGDHRLEVEFEEGGMLSQVLTGSEVGAVMAMMARLEAQVAMESAKDANLMSMLSRPHQSRRLPTKQA